MFANRTLLGAVKSLLWGGSLVRKEATGYGTVYFAGLMQGFRHPHRVTAITQRGYVDHRNLIGIQRFRLCIGHHILLFVFRVIPNDVAGSGHPQTVEQPVHIVEIADDLVDLQDLAIINPGGPQGVNVRFFHIPRSQSQ